VEGEGMGIDLSEGWRGEKWIKGEAQGMRREEERMKTTGKKKEIK